MSNPESGLIGARDAAAILGLSIRSVQREVAAGRLPIVAKFTGPKGPYVFDEAEIRDLAARRKERRVS